MDKLFTVSTFDMQMYRNIIIPTMFERSKNYTIYPFETTTNSKLILITTENIDILHKENNGHNISLYINARTLWDIVNTVENHFSNVVVKQVRTFHNTNDIVVWSDRLDENSYIVQVQEY